MRMRGWLLGLCATLMVLGAGLRPAAADDLYVVRGVPVDATAASATEARDIAIANGRAEAWAQLWRRLTPESEWASLPTLDAASLEAMVRSFTVANERRSSTRYLAEISYTFNATAVEAVLAQSGVSFTSGQAQPFVVVPVLLGEAGPVLWTQETAWATAFATANLANALVPILVPTGDVEDVATVSGATAATAGWEQLAPLAARYGAGRVLVAEATLTGQSLQVNWRAVTPEGETRDTLAVAVLADEEEAGLYGRAVAALSARLDTDWKSRTAASAGQTNQLQAVARFASLGEWNRIREAVSGLPTVERLDIQAVTADGASMAIVYRGMPEQLAAALAERGLALMEVQGGWEIAPQRMAPPPGMPPAPAPGALPGESL